MTQVLQQFAQFFDTDGSPLDAGYIYIGSVNQNPETNPISVYWDELFTIPAAQPIRTYNGYIVRNGTPARIYINSDEFSITIKNNKSRVIASLLDANSLSNLQQLLAASSGSSLVGFIQAGTGAVASELQTKERERVSILDFMTTAQRNDVLGRTGLIDVTSAVQAAITYCELGNYELEIFGKPKVTSTLTISGANTIHLIGKGWTSEISYTGTGDCIQIGNTGADQTADVRLLNFLITGNGSSSAGINAMRMHNWRVDGMRVRNCGGDGIKLQACYASWVLNNYFNNNGGSGIYAVALAAAGNDFLQLIGNRCLANTAKGIYIDNALYGPAGQRVELNDLEGNAIGFQLDVGSAGNTESLTFRGNYLENNTGYNASFGEDGGNKVLNNPMIEANNFMFGTVSAAANATRLGAAVRELNLVGNTFVTSDLVFNAAVTLGIVGGNKSNATVPTGIANDGGVTVNQLRLLQPGGGAASAIAMSGGMIRINYPTQWTGGAIFPVSAATATYQTACGLWAGTGAPDNANGQSGDYYMRSDTPGTANQRVYVKNGGSWTGIV